MQFFFLPTSEKAHYRISCWYAKSDVIWTQISCQNILSSIHSPVQKKSNFYRFFNTIQSVCQAFFNGILSAAHGMGHIRAQGKSCHETGAL